MAGGIPVLDDRALNRATLSRQLLLDRAELTVGEVLHRLVGLQAQTPHSWYVGLWSRLVDFRPRQAGDLLIDRSAVRIALMRSTIHLVTSQDCLALRALVQPAIERSLRGNFGKRLDGIDRDSLALAARELLAPGPLTFAELRPGLGERFPGRDPDALVIGVRAWVPLVQVPPRGVFGRSGPVAYAAAESWIDQPFPAGSLDELVTRYLRAFGPATVVDIQTWCGLTRLREVVDRLRPSLVSFHGADGRELLDVPDGPRPDRDTPAPVRFLYDYDNLLLSYANRSRVLTDGFFHQGFTVDSAMPSTVLIDGFTQGTWIVERRAHDATMTVQPFQPLTDSVADEVVAEGSSLLDLLVGVDGSHHILLAPPVRPRTGWIGRRGRGTRT